MRILDILFPKRCVGCGRIGKYICDRCAATIRRIDASICPMCEKPAIDGFTHPRCRTRYALDGLTSFFRYDGVVKKAVKTIKYRFVSDLAGAFVNLTSQVQLEVLTSRLPAGIILLPVPLHAERLRYRGFNQAESLGAILAARLNIPIKTDILRRVAKTVPQVQMISREERLRNMEHVFEATRQKAEENTDVVLFDDVFTTGATMRSAANTLKRCGVKKIWAVTMAR